MQALGAGTRDRLIQGYFQVDLQAVWAMVTDDLPPLRQRVQGLLDRASRLRAAFEARTACEPGVETFDTLTPRRGAPRRAAPRKLFSLFRKVPFAQAMA